MNIAWFRELHKKDVGLVGGKGASLGEMYNANFPIPPGFCVTAEAFKNFLINNNIRDKINSKLKDLNVEDNEALQRTSKEIQQIILNEDIGEELKEEILENYDNLNIDKEAFKEVKKEAMDIIRAGKEPPYVAVRSSATAEDLPSISKDEHILVKINDKTYFRKMEDIYNLVGEGYGYNIEIPAMKNNKIQWIKVGSLYKHKVKENEKLYKITTETGREIIVSPNHTLIVLDEDNLTAKEVMSIHDLKGNEKIPAINCLPAIDLKQEYIDILDYIKGEDIIENNGYLKIKNNSTNWKIQSGFPRKLKITRDLAYFLGVYCAEGSIYGTNEIIITNSDEKIMKRVINFASSLGLYNNQKINKYSLRIHNKTLTRFLNNVAGKPNPNIKGKGKICRNKRVPEFVFSWNKELIGEFLRGCYDGDGHCGKEKVIEYCSTSKMLISGIIKLLEILGIEWYLKGKRDKFNIIIRTSSFEKFESFIGFESEKKQKRLNNLIDKFKKQSYYPEFLNIFSVSSKLTQNIKDRFDELLPKQRVIASFCPKCNNKINKSSKYSGKERFYCEDCHKAFYENKVIKKEIEQYINYDLKGRFVKKGIPWNKGLISKRYGTKHFKKILNNYGINFESLNNSIIWDNIKEIKEVNYNGYVYDFCVPGAENFAAGLGGIITHNSASFAGQQATFLNVKGNNNLIYAVKACWASLYTARAIYYRTKNNFPHEKVYIAVIVQKQIHAKKAGVIFSVNPVNEDSNEILIEAGFGLGESVVSGSINPDKYIVDKTTLALKDKKIGNQDFVIMLDVNLNKNVKRKISNGNVQKLTEEEIRQLAEWTRKIEDHYKMPQDIEFAIENSHVYIVQSRPITTLKKDGVREKPKEITGELILEGEPASPGVKSGKVKIVHDLNELGKIEEGDVLVTRMTNPDMVPAMKRAKAIITDTGGASSHAAIVSREMGISCVVGTGKATQILKDGDIVTVDGSSGKVYRGEIKIKAEKEEIKEVVDYDTITQIKLIMDLPDIAEEVAKKVKVDGIGLLRLEMMIAENKIHPMQYIKENKDGEYIKMLEEGIGKIAKAFEGKPIWVRTSDMRTDEYRNLEGGENEAREANPMLGLHGIRKGMVEPRILKAEFKAIKNLHDKGLTNVGVMIPFVINLEEVRKAKDIMKEIGLEPCEEIEFGVMIETPASCMIIEDICKEGIDFVSFGTNDLTQLTLGLDRNNHNIDQWFDELHPAILKEMEMVIKTCRRYNIETSICGQAGSEPKMAEFLVKTGIDSISVNVDAVNEIKNMVAYTERRMLLNAARKNVTN